MRTIRLDRRAGTAFLFGAALALSGCGSAANSETPGGGGAGGAPAGSAGSGGSAPAPTAGAPAAGSPGSEGSGGSAGSAGSPARMDAAVRGPDSGAAPDAAVAPGGCPTRPNLTLAVHIVMNATWPGTTSAATGTDKIHVWNLTKVNVTGNELAGNQTRSCGTVLPPFSLTAGGRLVTGGERVQIEIPFSIWEAPTVPRLNSRGRLGGWNPGSSFAIDGTVALIGLTMDDPMAAWPASYTGIQAVDADGDGKPGFTAVPRSGGGFVQPPTGLGLFGSAPSADQVYIASRSVIGLDGRFTSCSDISGEARVVTFDSHAVGCHVRNGGECSANQTDFVDQNRTIYRITGGTFTAKQVPDDASCADVRTAVP